MEKNSDFVSKIFEVKDKLDLIEAEKLVSMPFDKDKSRFFANSVEGIGVEFPIQILIPRNVLGGFTCEQINQASERISRIVKKSSPFHKE